MEQNEPRPDLTPHATSVSEIRDLATVPLFSSTGPNLCGLLGVPRSTAYLLASQDRLGFPVLKIGKHYRVPVGHLLAVLGERDHAAAL